MITAVVAPLLIMKIEDNVAVLLSLLQLEEDKKYYTVIYNLSVY